MEARPGARFRVVRKVLLGLLILLLVAGLTGATFWGKEYRKLGQKLQAIRSRGEPTNFSELNAFYRVPADAPDSTDLWMAAFAALESANLSDSDNSLLMCGGITEPIPPPGQLWSDLEAARQLMEELELQRNLIRTAAKAGGVVRFPITLSENFDPIQDQISVTRLAGRVLMLDAHVATHSGDCQRALDDVGSFLSLSNALRGQPILIMELVRFAINSMAISAIMEQLPECSWNEDDLRLLQQQIASPDFHQEVITCMLGERAFALGMLRQYQLGPLRVWAECDVLQQYELFFSLMQQPLHVALKEFRSSATPVGQYAVLVSPNIEGTISSATRAQARQRCAVIAIAAARFKLKHGHLPASLAELQSSPGDFLNAADIFIDPFNGHQLLFKKTPTELVIYSVGEDSVDDGGVLDTAPQKDVGVTLRLPDSSR